MYQDLVDDEDDEIVAPGLLPNQKTNQHYRQSRIM